MENDIIGTDGKTPVQRLRHEVRNALGNATALMGGRAGLTKEDQAALVAEAQEEVAKAATALAQIAALVANRDFEAHQAEKAAQREAMAIIEGFETEVEAL